MSGLLMQENYMKEYSRTLIAVLIGSLITIAVVKSQYSEAGKVNIINAENSIIIYAPQNSD